MRELLTSECRPCILPALHLPSWSSRPPRAARSLLMRFFRRVQPQPRRPLKTALPLPAVPARPRSVVWPCLVRTVERAASRLTRARRWLALRLDCRPSRCPFIGVQLIVPVSVGGDRAKFSAEWVRIALHAGVIPS